ncbi:MAG: tyrosine-type recombinase/integrase [Aridibacter sp.]
MAIYQRGESWYIDVIINGKRVRRAIKEARTEEQALYVEESLKDEMFEGKYRLCAKCRNPISFKQKLFSEFVENRLFSEFVENSYIPFAKDKKKESTYRVEKSVLKDLLKEFGKQKLVEITTEQIEQFKRRRASEITQWKSKRSKATVNRDIAVLSAIFKLAKSYGEIKKNPVKSVEYYTNLPSRTRVLSEVEERILFKKIKDDVEFSRQIEILLYTGMRRGELFKLEWQDVDLADGFITLRAETTKTSKSRDVVMFENIIEIFKQLKSKAGNVDKTDRIFTGTKSQAGTFSRKFREVCSELGWDTLTVHSLRHTFSTRANEAGVDPFAQKAVLGHSKLNQTDKYTHQSKETIKAGMKPFMERLAKRK